MTGYLVFQQATSVTEGLVTLVTLEKGFNGFISLRCDALWVSGAIVVPQAWECLCQKLK